MKRFIIILSLLTISFMQDGEVTNVTASQRTDGSGIVDISYELLPDDTFPSFNVEAYALNMSLHIWYESNEDGGIDVYLNSGNQAVSGITFDWLYMDGYTICPAFSFSSDVDFSSNPLFSNWDTNSETYWNPGDAFPSINIEMFAPGLNPSENTYNGSGEDVIPVGTNHLFLFTITNVNSELMTNTGCSSPSESDISSISIWSDSDTYNWESLDYFNDQRDVLYPLQISSTAGIGENIFPGVYNFSYQLQDNFYHPALKIRIIAEAYIFNSDLPFTMVSIPSGDYYDLDGIQQTMEYSYEIMETELTNNHIVEWALLYGELSNDDDESNQMWSLASMFEHINYDGGTLAIEPGYTHFPAVFSQYGGMVGDGYEEGNPLFLFFDYYGLRVPTQDEWIYAARGDNESYFPWSNTGTSSCYIEDDDMLGQWYCIADCFENAFCIDGEWPFSVDGIYDTGSYPNNASPFGALDMLGNVQEIYANENGSLNYFDCLGGLSYFNELISVYNNNDDCNVNWGPWDSNPYCNNVSAIYECFDADSDGEFGLRLVRTIIE